MATIPRPTTKTVISTTQWGIPITDQVNTNTTAIANGVTATAWTNATLTNGWTHNATTPVQYRKVGDIVYVRGRAENGQIGVPVFTTPTGFRTAKDMVLNVSGVVSGAWGTAFIELRNNGEFVLMMPTGVTSLATVGLWSTTA